MAVAPTFFVVGAPKSGTSALYEFARQHRDIFVPTIKEPHYFTSERAAHSYYRPRVVRNEDEYRRLYRGASDSRAAGDFSPSYLYSPEAAKRIRAYNPDARIIAILRDPTRRTVSHYLMDVSKGLQDRPLSEFLERSPTNARYYDEYVGMSLYADGIECYLETFGRDRVLVLTAEQLRADGAAVCRRLFRFVGVDDKEPVRSDGVYNAYAEPRFAIVRAMRASGVTYTAFRSLPEPLRRWIKRAAQRQGGGRPAFEAEQRWLDRFFEPELRRLSRLLDSPIVEQWLHGRATAESAIGPAR